MFVRTLIATGMLLAIGACGGSPTTPSAVATPSDIVASGRIRVAIDTRFAPTDATTNQPGGIAEIARELAKRMNVRLEMTLYPNVNNQDVDLAARTVDVAVMLPYEPNRFQGIVFTRPMETIDTTLLVPAGSPIHVRSDADKPGIRIAVFGTSNEALIRSTAQKATISVPANATVGLDLRSNQADALAQYRFQLLPLVPQLPGSQVLNDTWAVTPQMMAVAADRPQLAAYIRDFAEQVRTDGLLAQWLDRAGIAGFRAVKTW